MSQPNIIFIMTDQQRWDALGVNGNALIHTPNLDRLGKAGASIQHSYTAAIACCPSRAGIWTGTYAHTHGVTKTGIKENPDIPTLAGELSKAGYMTSGVGKMHFNPWDRLYGFDKRIIIDSKYCKQSDAYNLHLKEMDKEDGRIGHHTPEFCKNFKSMPTVDLAT